MRFNNLYIILIALLFTFCESESGDSSGIGQGGSMTRFAIQNNFLYIVDNHTIKVFDISENNFVQLNEVTVGFGLETIFARAEYLYLGANDAMYIYSLEDPALPRFIFRYAHIVACDPVVVQGNRAYITLRSADDNSFCNRGINALEIIDITDPNQPKLLASYAMQSPHGLAVDGDYLFLCEGTGGLKFIDISNELDIKTLQHIEDIDAYDVIARNGLLILTGEDGIFQFSYSEDAEELQLISKLPVSREVL